MAGASDASEMVATREEMKRAKLDVAYRDFCAHLLIPLNECRRKSFYLPWKCEHERHVYEKCQYKECVWTGFLAWFRFRGARRDDARAREKREIVVRSTLLDGWVLSVLIDV